MSWVIAGGISWIICWEVLWVFLISSECWAVLWVFLISCECSVVLWVFLISWECCDGSVASGLSGMKCSVRTLQLSSTCSDQQINKYVITLIGVKLLGGEGAINSIFPFMIRTLQHLYISHFRLIWACILIEFHTEQEMNTRIWLVNVYVYVY